MTKRPKSEPGAWEKGRRAQEIGIAYTACPYSKDDPLRSQWQLGFREGAETNTTRLDEQERVVGQNYDPHQRDQDGDPLDDDRDIGDELQLIEKE